MLKSFDNIHGREPIPKMSSEEFERRKRPPLPPENIDDLHQEALRVNEEIDEQKEKSSKNALAELIIRERADQIQDQFYYKPEVVRDIEQIYRRKKLIGGLTVYIDPEAQGKLEEFFKDLEPKSPDLILNHLESFNTLLPLAYKKTTTPEDLPILYIHSENRFEQWGVSGHIQSALGEIHKARSGKKNIHLFDTELGSLSMQELFFHELTHAAQPNSAGRPRPDPWDIFKEGYAVFVEKSFDRERKSENEPRFNTNIAIHQNLIEDIKENVVIQKESNSYTTHPIIKAMRNDGTIYMDISELLKDESQTEPWGEENAFLFLTAEYYFMASLIDWYQATYQEDMYAALDRSIAIDKRLYGIYKKYDSNGEIPSRLRDLVEDEQKEIESMMFLGLKAEEAQAYIDELEAALDSDNIDHEYVNKIADRLSKHFSLSFSDMQNKYNDFINAVNGNIGNK